MTARSYHLPDPETQPEFYQDVATKRLLAWVIDTGIILVITMAVVLLTAFIGLLFVGFLSMIIGFVYRIATLAGNSATWGMRFVSIEFRSADGMRFDASQAFLHTLGYTVSLAMPLLQLVSVVLMLTSARGQGLTDHLMGSVAINRAARN